ncbi:hypothetical protein [Niveibacterium microcysteis]|uniref:GGDEF domain-containing protein n=1 Tax=Niveibacterium microcysteis TaxID=2811415 RepID=A0ABX7MDA4_9RHOO|nr:hypothetical protein [Niveibacterium microcysteis]QSI78625.1 hypothetical protein JY500_08480 [Niveibacterium microcysteis]
MTTALGPFVAVEEFHRIIREQAMDRRIDDAAVIVVLQVHLAEPAAAAPALPTGSLSAGMMATLANSIRLSDVATELAPWRFAVLFRMKAQQHLPALLDRLLPLVQRIFDDQETLAKRLLIDVSHAFLSPGSSGSDWLQQAAAGVQHRSADNIQSA